MLTSGRRHEPSLRSDCDADRYVRCHRRRQRRGPLHFHQICRLGWMMLPTAIFTLDIDGIPTLAFEARNLRESQQLCHEAWLRQDISDLTSNGSPLWDGKARLRARRSTEDEIAVYREAAREA